VVRDLRERRVPASPEELADFETDVLAGFVLARASAGLADGTIRSNTGHLEQTRTWFGRPGVSLRKLLGAAIHGISPGQCIAVAALWCGQRSLS
jgi:hypothetical protein